MSDKVTGALVSAGAIVAATIGALVVAAVLMTISGALGFGIAYSATIVVNGLAGTSLSPIKFGLIGGIVSMLTEEWGSEVAE